jgi:WD40 repeat protein
VIPLSLLAFAFAADTPKPREFKTPITTENSTRLKIVEVVPGRVDKIRRGPGRGKLILSDWTKGAVVANETTLQTIRPIAEGHKELSLAVSPDGKRIAWNSGASQTVTIENVADGKSFPIKFEHSPAMTAFSPDGKLIAIGSMYWDPNAEGVGHSELMLFDAAGKHLKTFDRTPPGAQTPVFSPDGKILAVGNRNDKTILHEATTGKILHTLSKRMTQEIAFSPDGKTLATGYVDGTVALWDVETGIMLHSAKSGCQEVYSVDWSPKGDVLATSGLKGRPVLWDPRGLKKLKELDAMNWIGQIRFTADGTRLLTACATGNNERNPFNEWKMTVWAIADR